MRKYTHVGKQTRLLPIRTIHNKCCYDSAHRLDYKTLDCIVSLDDKYGIVSCVKVNDGNKEERLKRFRSKTFVYSIKQALGI